MKYVFLTYLLFGCAQDVSLVGIKPYQEDTANMNTGPSEEPSAPTTEPSEEPSSEMTELTIGFAEISFSQIACPACVGVSSEFDIFANLRLHSPTSGGYNEWLTPVGSCTDQIIQTHVSAQPLAATQQAQFDSISLYPTGQGEWTVSNILEYQIPRRTQMTITTEHGIIPAAFESLEGFDSIEPYTLLWVDPSYAFEAVVSKQGTNFNWYPSIPDAQFEIMVVVYSPDGSQLLGTVSCMENDVGFMFVPGSYFQSYPNWALVAVYLTRHKTDRQPAYEFNGWLESHMTWTVLGTGHIE